MKEQAKVISMAVTRDEQTIIFEEVATLVVMDAMLEGTHMDETVAKLKQMFTIKRN
jgi:hypothetical protein